MRFCLIGIPSDRWAASGEVAIVVPGVPKVSIQVPFAALADFLPLLYEAMRGLGGQRCAACAAPLVTVPSAEVDHA